MMFDRHLCLTVLLFTLFGASFCLRSYEKLEKALSEANSNSGLADVLKDVVEFCFEKGYIGLAVRVEDLVEELMLHRGIDIVAYAKDYLGRCRL
ncbi:uncharacterized protein LOC141850937 isoform X2 [Brevipalpus obovatus]|uniref:uncharacterized protein LOC141850937 isoform X2 n=1 Tax=Brevipalpus obovatus TaxID=246614 RepID=UPI003D9EF0E1